VREILGRRPVRGRLEVVSEARQTKFSELFQLLGLLHAYPKNDLLRAMQRAVQCHAVGFTSLERILAHQATPKPNWQHLDEASQESLKRLANSEPIGPRHSQEYQQLLYGTSGSTLQRRRCTQRSWLDGVRHERRLRRLDGVFRRSSVGDDTARPRGRWRDRDPLRRQIVSPAPGRAKPNHLIARHPPDQRIFHEY